MNNNGVKKIEAPYYLVSGLIYLLEILMFFMAISALWGWHAIDLLALCIMSASFYDKRKNLRRLLAGDRDERAYGIFCATLMGFALILNSAYWAIHLLR